MKVSTQITLIVSIILLLILSFSTLVYLQNQPVSNGGHIESIFQDPSGKVPVMAINLAPTEDVTSALLKGDVLLVLATTLKNSNSFLVLHHYSALVQLQGGPVVAIDASNNLYQNLVVGQLYAGGSRMRSKTLAEFGIRSLNFNNQADDDIETTEPVDIGEAVMANNQHYPIEILWLEPRYLNLSMEALVQPSPAPVKP